MGTSFKNVKDAHDVNGQIMNPVPVDFNLPLTISNPEDPEQQTPIALHVIVDNASDFPSGGGSGGGVAFLTIPSGFMADIVDDQTSLIDFFVFSPDRNHMYGHIQLNPELDENSSYIISVPANTPFVIDMMAGPDVSFTISEYIYIFDPQQEVVICSFGFATGLINDRGVARYPDGVDPIVLDSNDSYFSYVIYLGLPPAPK